MANIKATAGGSNVSFTLTSGQKITFPASATSQAFCTSSDLVDLQRSGLLDAAIAGGKLSTVSMSFDDGAAMTDASGTGATHQLLGRQVFTTNGTYTPTPGCNRVMLRMVGAGGGGGGVANSAGAQTAVGGGGASGDYLEKWIDPGAGNYPIAGGAVTVSNAGGAGGVNTGAAGSTGGNSTIAINGTTYTAKGGTGGAFTGSAASAQICAGGASQGGSSTGDVTVPAEPGVPGFTQSGTLGESGQGGNSPLGSGGASRIAHGTGNNATGNGAGGSGALSVNAAGALTGGNGSPGLIIIDEYT